MKRAFTLIELLIVIAVLGLLAAIGATALGRFRAGIVVDAAAEEGVSLLSTARAGTLAYKEASSYGLHFANDRMVVFHGTVYDPMDADNDIVLLPGSVELSSVELNGGGSDVLFDRLTGATDEYGTVTFRSRVDPSVTRFVNVLPSGLLRSRPVYYEETETPPLCQWAVFSHGDVDIRSGALIDSYDSGGGGTTNEGNVQTNSIVHHAVFMGQNSTIDGTLTIGPGGDPADVLDPKTGSSITGGAVLVSPSLIAMPPPEPPAAATSVSVTPPVPVGTPLTVNTGEILSVNVCVNPPSTIDIKQNGQLTLEGDCPLVMGDISISSGGKLFVEGNIGTLDLDEFFMGQGVTVSFSAPVAITATHIDMNGGTSLTVSGTLTATTDYFDVGQNITVVINGDLVASTDHFDIDSGTSFTINGDFAADTPYFDIGQDVVLGVSGAFTAVADHFALDAGTDLTAGGDIVVEGGFFDVGQRVDITAPTIDARFDKGEVNAGSPPSSIASTGAIPGDVRFAITGTDQMYFGQGVQFTGVVYAPSAHIEVKSNAEVKGALVGNDVFIGQDAHVQYDEALGGAGCLL